MPVIQKIYYGLKVAMIIPGLVIYAVLSFCSFILDVIVEHLTGGRNGEDRI